MYVQQKVPTINKVMSGTNPIKFRPARKSRIAFCSAPRTHPNCYRYKGTDCWYGVSRQLSIGNIYRTVDMNLSTILIISEVGAF